jgi:hypothetical protein
MRTGREKRLGGNGLLRFPDSLDSGGGRGSVAEEEGRERKRIWKED